MANDSAVVTPDSLLGVLLGSITLTRSRGVILAERSIYPVFLWRKVGNCAQTRQLIEWKAFDVLKFAIWAPRTETEQIVLAYVPLDVAHWAAKRAQLAESLVVVGTILLSTITQGSLVAINTFLLQKWLMRSD